jgi:integrase
MLAWQDAPAAIAKMREKDVMSAPCLAFVALTGVRLTKARAAQWSEIDFDAAAWTIPADRMKTRKQRREPHTVPPSRQALGLLAALEAQDRVLFVLRPRPARPNQPRKGVGNVRPRHRRRSPAARLTGDVPVVVRGERRAARGCQERVGAHARRGRGGLQSRGDG